MGVYILSTSALKVSNTLPIESFSWPMGIDEEGLENYQNDQT